jgi:hypothetical protein
MMSDESVRAEINKRCADVEMIHRPSVMQYVTWKDLVDWEDGTDPDGWFIGVCPISHVEKGPGHMAQYTFHKGTVKCEEGCLNPTGRKSASLTRVIEAIAIQQLRSTPLD